MNEIVAVTWRFTTDRMRVINVGAISDLTWDCSGSEYLQAIYAGNGVGKTTLLECMSLVGHLPCMPILGMTRGGPNGFLGTRGSLLRQCLSENGQTAQELRDVVQVVTGPQPIGLDAFVAEFARRGFSDIGLVRFDVTNGDDSISFVVLIRASESAAPVLTTLLSRSVGGEYSPDTDLELNFLALDFTTSSSDDRFGRLNFSLARGRTFSLAEKCHEYLDAILDRTRASLGSAKGAESRESLVAEVKAESDPLKEVAELLGDRRGPALRISYVNTDLNDFGRGNDLRESPKDLRETIDEQVVNRFRLDFSGANREYAHRDQLNDCLSKVLPAVRSHYSDVHAIGDGLQITTFRLKQGETGDTADLWVRRGDSKPIPAKYLSAGENEVFFILLMCLAVNPPNSSGEHAGIILLDEPDLHLANAAKLTFFSQIVEILSGMQVLIASHSYSAAGAIERSRRPLAKHVSVLYRAMAPGNIEELRVAFDPRYLAAVRSLSPNLDQPTISSSRMPRWLRHRRYVNAFRLRTWLLGRLTSHFGSEFYRIRFAGFLATIGTVTLMIVLPVVAAFAVGNDIADIVADPSGNAGFESDVVRSIHQKVTYASAVCLFLGIFMLIYGISNWLMGLIAGRRPNDPEYQYGSRNPWFSPLWSIAASALGSGLFLVLLAPFTG